MKGTVANHCAAAEIQVQDRRKTQVHPAGAQFRRQHIARGVGKMARTLRMLVPYLSQCAHWRQQREALAEALHTAAFVIDRDQQRRVAQGVDVGGQFGDLARRFVIA